MKRAKKIVRGAAALLVVFGMSLSASAENSKQCAGIAQNVLGEVINHPIIDASPPTTPEERAKMLAKEEEAEKNAPRNVLGELIWNPIIDNSPPSTPQELARMAKELMSNWGSRFLSASYSVPLYRQDDSAWSKEPLGTSAKDTGDTMGKGGCLVTCVSMYHDFLGDSTNNNLDPGKMNKTLKAAGLDTSSLSLEGVAKKFGYTSGIAYRGSDLSDTKKFTPDYVIQNIIMPELKSRPVIVGLVSTLNASKTHFVVATGNDGNVISINDPMSKVNHTTLKQYIDDGYRIDVLRSFYFDK